MKLGQVELQPLKMIQKLVKQTNRKSTNNDLDTK
jgi:hypothetical protein